MLDLILKRLHQSIPEEAAELLARLVGAMIRVCACYNLLEVSTYLEETAEGNMVIAFETRVAWPGMWSSRSQAINPP